LGLNNLILNIFGASVSQFWRAALNLWIWRVIITWENSWFGLVWQ